MFGLERKQSMPSPADALPGRDTPMPVPAKHYVLGTPMEPEETESLRFALFGLGCFWGVERRYWQLDGVYTTAVGYAGGLTPNPTYAEVCSGMTGHNEVVRVAYEPAKVSYRELLQVFWESHDPTQGMRQGNDVGTQYRSVIYYHDEKQKAESQAMIDALQKQIREPIVTELSPLSNFYPAEQYHQDYYNENPNQGYCSILIAPKLAKFEQYFADKLK